MRGQVLYELHVGAFTGEGTFDAAAADIANLRELGVTVLELMPVAEFPGKHNWGYDGVVSSRPFTVTATNMRCAASSTPRTPSASQ